MFILIMQFFWVYIDDLMGKGLGVFTILELLFYVSASLIPLALPLSILLSSLMTFGNFAEHNELTALKSNGFSLMRIMRPLTIIVCFIALFTFYFSNYIIPIANLKWHSLIYDIQNTKLSKLIQPGVYTNEIDGYTIKVQSNKGGVYTEVTIHDHTDPKIVKSIKAEKAKIYRSISGNYLFFDLVKGTIYEELNTDHIQQPSLIADSKNTQHLYPDRITSFERATYRLNVSGMTLKRTDEDIFQDKYEMMNVFQIGTANDSLQKRKAEMGDRFTASILGSFPSFESIQSNKKTDIKMDPGIVPPTPPKPFHTLQKAERKQLMQNVVTKLYQINENIRNHQQFLKVIDNERAQFWIEFHKKFALTYTVFILFFVGAPLGAVVRKGGFGAPVVIAALLFMVYFILYSIGENLADTYVVAPWFGMWIPSMFFTPIAFIVSYFANNDRSFEVKKIFSFLRFKRT